MQAVNRKAGEVIAALADGVTRDTPKLVDNAPAAYMPVQVEVVGHCALGPLYSVAHYGEQNGDLMRDPDVVFVHAHLDGRWYPVSIRNDYVGTFHEPVEFNAAGEWTGVDIDGQRDIARFSNQWLRNVREQQHPDTTPRRGALSRTT